VCYHISVGYSYCAAMADGTGQCSNTDDSTAAAARAAVQDFYAKFPELLAAPLYITGESYAGK
jgi:carboxypeptidase C (cathepsin A)